MKRIIIITLALAVTFWFSGCGGGLGKYRNRGELVGILDRPDWDDPTPYGTVLVLGGQFHMGNNEQDVPSSLIAMARQVTVSSFYMDDTEITNNEYRQFIQLLHYGAGDPDASGMGDKMSELAQNSQDSVVIYKYKTTYPEFMGRFQGYVYKPIKEDEKELGTKEINCYPDTTAWERDFSYAFHDPMVENYFWHPAYDEYPVVGVNWYAAKVFCNWRTIHYNTYRMSKQRAPIPRFRLPTEAEWEYAARGGLDHKLYPWIQPYLRNEKGCFLANFKPNRGNYVDDYFEYTCNVDAYFPNEYGIYNVAGNVSEWCEDGFHETAYQLTHDHNPIYKNDKEARKVIRGGSWKDIAYFLSVGTRSYEFADTAKSFIGFRCVTSQLGRSLYGRTTVTY